jgi:hypothetical protein
MIKIVPDDPSKLRFTEGYQLSERSIRLELLDEDGSVVSFGTGIMMSEDNGVFLYTCWHTVTGYDFLNLKVIYPPRIKSVALHTKVIRQENPAVVAVGGETRDLYSLYDENGDPIWEQEEGERPHLDLNEIGVRVPKHCDIVSVLPP